MGRGGRNKKDAFGSYLAQKRQKQAKQFQAAHTATTTLPCEVPHALPKSSFFAGVTVYCTGHTIPTHNEIRDLLYQNGGEFLQFFRPSIVTHVVAETLSQSKYNIFRKALSGPLVVRPSWILECVKMFGADFFTGGAFFVLASLAAISFCVTWLLGLVGAVTGTAYAVGRVAVQASLENARQQQRLRGHYD